MVSRYINIFEVLWMHVHALHNTQWGIYASEFCGPLIYVPFACGLCAFFGRQLFKIAISSALGNKFFSIYGQKKLNEDSLESFFLNLEIKTLKALAYSFALINFQDRAL
jgi:hypothetical protein